MAPQSARKTQEQLRLAYVVMVARGAGYAVTDAIARAGHVWLTFANPTRDCRTHYVAVAYACSAVDILRILRDLAGEANQPSTAPTVPETRPADYAQLQQELARPSAGRYVTFLDREACVCEFGHRPNERVNRMHIRPDDMPAIECGLPESVARKYENYRPGMIDAVIAEQVKAGGVDTEGSRAQAERWLAMVCACVCSGLRATTKRSQNCTTHRDTPEQAP